MYNMNITWTGGAQNETTWKSRSAETSLQLRCERNYQMPRLSHYTQELAERLPRVSFLSAAAARGSSLKQDSRIESEFCLIHAAAACFTPWALFYITNFYAALVDFADDAPAYTLLIQCFVHITVFCLICSWVERSQNIIGYCFDLKLTSRKCDLHYKLTLLDGC